MASLALLGALASSAPVGGAATAAGAVEAVAGARPCDLFRAGGTPCVAAHSTVRALYQSYSGALYSVKRVGNDGCGKGDLTSTTSNSGASPAAVANNNAAGGLCGCTPDGKTVTLTCPAAGTVTAVTFASIGTPSGSCGNLTAVSLNTIIHN